MFCSTEVKNWEQPFLSSTFQIQMTAIQSKAETKSVSMMAHPLLFDALNCVPSQADAVWRVKSFFLPWSIGGWTGCGPLSS